MFYGQKEERPIHMDTFSRREIPQFTNGAWFGWHSFRRGLGNRLNDIGMNGVDMNPASHEHSDDSRYYTFPNPEKARQGLRKLTEAVRKKYGIKA